MNQESPTTNGSECLLNIEELIDPRIRENKIYNDCINILLEENYKPENADINFRIKEICVRLDRELEKATLLYRERNGTPYVNSETKETKYKPIPYKQLSVSLSESIKLASIYTDKYNEKQIQVRTRELQDFTRTPNKEIFLENMEQLKNLYSFSVKDIMYITHWLTNVKRVILNMDIELPQILCFTSNRQYIGKSFLAETMAQVINKRIVSTDLIKLSARFQPLSLTTEAVLCIDELGKLDKTISDNIKSMITANTISFELKGKNGHKQYRKLASLILTTNYDPSKIFYEDERQRRIAIIEFNGYTEKKTRQELETLVSNIWENSPIEYSIEPDLIAEFALSETKESSILENFAKDYVLNMFVENEYLTATEIMGNLYSYNGGRQKLIAFLKNDEYFMQKNRTNGVLKFKATDTFKDLLKDLLQDKSEFFDNNLYEFKKAV